MNSPTSISSDSLQKRAVVSLDDGKRIGHVEDLLVDTQKLKLAALVVRGDNGQSVLPWTKIHNIGEDAITVEGMSSTQSGADSLPEVRSCSEFHGQNVLDSGGTLVGHLRHVEFDAVSGHILSLEAHKGGVFGIGGDSIQIPGADIRSFGPDLITINVATVNA